MIGLGFTFELGRYHATPWGRHVNDGAVEWPPAPLRILRALFAVSRQHAELQPSRVGIDRALSALVAADPPRYVLPASAESHTRHFLPLTTRGKSALVLDGFRAVPVDQPLEVWWSLELATGERVALAECTRRLGYLGRSEAVCRVELLQEPAPTTWHAAPAASADAPAHGEPIDLLCPDGDAALEVLAADVGAMQKARRRLPTGTRLAAYVRSEPRAAGSSPNDERPPSPTIALFRLVGGSRPGLREAVLVTDRLRAAAQARYGALRGGASSPVLSGRDGQHPRSDQHRHAHYLALADPGSRRVDRLVVWAPEGLGPAEVAALASVRRLAGYGFDDPLDVALAAAASEHELRLPELLGPARRWQTSTPFVLVRHPKRRADVVRDGPEDQVRRELELRGLPDAQVRLLQGAWHEFRRSRPSRSALTAPGAFGVELEFGAPLTGPLVLGALCHFGLGRFRPVAE